MKALILAVVPLLASCTTASTLLTQGKYYCQFQATVVGSLALATGNMACEVEGPAGPPTLPTAVPAVVIAPVVAK